MRDQECIQTEETLSESLVTMNLKNSYSYFKGSKVIVASIPIFRRMVCVGSPTLRYQVQLVKPAKDLFA
jgi:hypothetical protein